MFIQNVVLQVAVLVTCVLNNVLAQSRRPNIILILADDLVGNQINKFNKWIQNYMHKMLVRSLK